MRKDRLGRRRQPGQERGLRPLHPALPARWKSQAVRVAMSESDWQRFEALVGSVLNESSAITQARANGVVISSLMDSTHRGDVGPGPLDWMDWERQKTLRLLRVRSAV